MPEIKFYIVERTQEVEISAESPAQAIALAESVWTLDNDNVDPEIRLTRRIRTTSTSSREKF